jgi:hypothetical protein
MPMDTCTWAVRLPPLPQKSTAIYPAPASPTDPRERRGTGGCPGGDVGVLMRGELVHDQVQLLARSALPQQLEEAQETPDRACARGCGR